MDHRQPQGGSPHQTNSGGVWPPSANSAYGAQSAAAPAPVPVSRPFVGGAVAADIYPATPPAPAPAPAPQVWQAEPAALEPPVPVPVAEAIATPADGSPVPVVQVLSTRGVEYYLMTLSLWFSAFALGWVLVAFVNGGTSLTVLAFPTSLLVVSLPVFAGLFLRLKNAELANPALRFDPSKRRSTQTTQVGTFLICLFALVSLLVAIMSKIGGRFEDSLLKAFLDVLIVVLIAGGIFAYYWWDEHQGRA